MLKHGGNIDEAAARYGIPKEEWLDLSTGLNPEPWQVPTNIPPECYERLPYPDPSLHATACRYYGTPNLLAVSGSQPVIQALPRLLTTRKVAIPVPGYAEHYHHWQLNGHDVVTYDPDSDDLLTVIQQQRPDVLLVINPNNPSCRLYSRDELIIVLKEMERMQGLLIIDEAFIDTRPEHSLAHLSSDHLIILRSLGKFFGLPGIRAGFVIANASLRDMLNEHLGHWTLSGATQWIATRCLADHDWHVRARSSIKRAAEAQTQLLISSLGTLGTIEIRMTDYFVTCYMAQPQAHDMQDFYAKQGILLRLIDLDDGKSLIRLGLCPSRHMKLEAVTQQWVHSTLPFNSAIG